MQLSGQIKNSTAYIITVKLYFQSLVHNCNTSETIKHMQTE